ncbi:unnamed protein product [Penicillium olsonii]|nr:unnamed protein product [Penicillium olsonii]
MEPHKPSIEQLEKAMDSPLDRYGDYAHQQKLTRRIMLKLDTRILPMLALLFLCSFLDRTNVGNAKIIGLEEDLSITDHQYDVGLAVFYLTYICSELPSNLVLKKASPKLWLPFLTAVWGIITMCLGFVQNYAGFVAVRALLGVAEGGLLPGMTFVCGILSFFVLPNSLETASFLTVEEKAFGRERLMLDNPRSAEGTLASEAESFKWSEVRRGVLDIQVWLSASAYFAILSGLYSFGLFLPTIIKSLGFAKDANEVQLWSVIPYAVAAVVTVMLFTLPVAIIGYAVIANIDSPRVQYGMTFLMATGQYASVPCILVWLSNNSAGHYKRATTSAMQLAIANAGGFVATFNYPTRDGPLFHRGHTIILGLLVFAWFTILLNVLYCAKINRDKKNGKYAQYAGYADDRNPEFMMVL